MYCYLIENCSGEYIKLFSGKNDRIIRFESWIPCILKYSYYNTHIDGEINANKMGGELATIECRINFNMFSHLSALLSNVRIMHNFSKSC